MARRTVTHDVKAPSNRCKELYSAICKIATNTWFSTICSVSGIKETLHLVVLNRSEGILQIARTKIAINDYSGILQIANLQK